MATWLRMVMRSFEVDKHGNLVEDGDEVFEVNKHGNLVEDRNEVAGGGVREEAGPDVTRVKNRRLLIDV
jgi:hypothetical protein